MIRAFLMFVVLAACDDPPDALCAQLCDDGDPCTDDACNPATGECFAVPRGAANACRTNAHCDDGLACTVDACAVDECGFQRCVNDAQACQTCFAAEECVGDDDPCTLEVCRGFCESVPTNLCDDRRCDPEAETPVGAVRLTGQVEPASACGCDCTTDATLAGVDFSEELASCTVACPASLANTRCEPLAANLAWQMYVSSSGGEQRLEQWCLAPSELLVRHGWTARIELPDQPAMTCDVTSVGGSGSTLSFDSCHCERCFMIPFGSIFDLDVGPFIVSGDMFMNTNFFGQRRFRFLLAPTRTGFTGVLRSNDDGSFGTEPIIGDIVMTLNELAP